MSSAEEEPIVGRDLRSFLNAGDGTDDHELRVLNDPFSFQARHSNENNGVYTPPKFNGTRLEHAGGGDATFSVAEEFVAPTMRELLKQFATSFLHLSDEDIEKHSSRTPILVPPPFPVNSASLPGETNTPTKSYRGKKKRNIKTQYELVKEGGFHVRSQQEYNRSLKDASELKKRVLPSLLDALMTHAPRRESDSYVAHFRNPDSPDTVHRVHREGDANVLREKQFFGMNLVDYPPTGPFINSVEGQADATVGTGEEAKLEAKISVLLSELAAMRATREEGQDAEYAELTMFPPLPKDGNTIISNFEHYVEGGEVGSQMKCKPIGSYLDASGWLACDFTNSTTFNGSSGENQLMYYAACKVKAPPVKWDETNGWQLGDVLFADHQSLAQGLKVAFRSWKQAKINRTSGSDPLLSAADFTMQVARRFANAAEAPGDSENWDKKKFIFYVVKGLYDDAQSG